MLVRVGRTLDVGSGWMVAFDVDGTPVAVANVNGRLLAFDDTCTRNGCSLATGDLDGATVTCPCHGSQFDVTSGAVLRGRRRRRFGRGPSRSTAKICSSRSERVSSAAGVTQTGRQAGIRLCDGRRTGSRIGRPSSRSTGRTGSYTSDVLLSRLKLNDLAGVVFRPKARVRPVPSYARSPVRERSGAP